MNDCSHRGSYFFPNREEVQSVFTALIERSVPRDRLQMFDADTPGACTCTK